MDVHFDLIVRKHCSLGQDGNLKYKKEHVKPQLQLSSFNCDMCDHSVNLYGTLELHNTKQHAEKVIEQLRTENSKLREKLKTQQSGVSLKVLTETHHSFTFQHSCNSCGKGFTHKSNLEK